MTTLAIDVGQSGSRARRSDAAGEIDLVGILTTEPLLPQLAAIVVDARPQAIVAIGSTGITPEHRAADLLALLPEEVRELHLAHDSVTSYLGALGDRPGAVVASGTGVVTLAVGPAAVARVDGWGYLIGDAGSGFWMGRRALDTVMRAHDGRGQPTSLVDAISRDFDDLESAYIELQNDPDRVRRIASYARVVAEHAATDLIAASIIDMAAAELALSVAAGLVRVGKNSDAVVATIGNVFKGARLAQVFARELGMRHNGTVVVAPAGLGIDGAALLPSLSSRTGLSSKVDVARR